jgi:hypothetical protein
MAAVRVCGACPLRERCTTSRTGRTLSLHPHHGPPHAARAAWAPSLGLREDYMAHRPQCRPRHRAGLLISSDNEHHTRAEVLQSSPGVPQRHVMRQVRRSLENGEHPGRKPSTGTRSAPPNPPPSGSAPCTSRSSTAPAPRAGPAAAHGLGAMLLDTLARVERLCGPGAPHAVDAPVANSAGELAHRTSSLASGTCVARVARRNLAAVKMVPTSSSTPRIRTRPPRN